MKEPSTIQQELRDSWQRIMATTKLELKLNLQGAGLWIAALAVAILGFLAAWAGASSGSIVISRYLSNDLGSLVQIILVFVAAAVAYRPLRHDVMELQDSKIVRTEELLLGRWLALQVIVVAPVVAMMILAWLGQTVNAGGSAKSAVYPLAYLQSFVSLLPPVLFFSTLTFLCVTSIRVLVAGAGLAGIAWFVATFGTGHYPEILRLNLGQNRTIAYMLTAAILLFMLLQHKGRRRAKHARTTYALATALVAVCVGAGLSSARIMLTQPGAARSRTVRLRLGESIYAPSSLRPNFAWTDADGKRVSIAEWRGRKLLLYFFEPVTYQSSDPDLILDLQALAKLRTMWPKDKVGILAICLSEDLNTGAEVAALAGGSRTLGFSVVTDWGQATRRPGGEPESVAAAGYKIRATPIVIVLDEFGREMGSARAQDEGLKNFVETGVRPPR